MHKYEIVTADYCLKLINGQVAAFREKKLAKLNEHKLVLLIAFLKALDCDY